MVLQRIAFPFEQLTLLDITAAGSLEYRTYKNCELSDTQRSCLLHLRPPRRAAGPFSIKRSSERQGRLTFQNRLRTVLQESDPKHTFYVLGSNFDPFSAAGSRFRLGMIALSELAKTQPAALCVQTASPMIMLGTPILRSLDGNAAVTMALEASDARHAALQQEASARPKERMETIRTLREAGLTTVLQLAPVGSIESMRSYAARVQESAHFATIAYAYAQKALCERLEFELIRRAPHMLIDSVADIWREGAFEQEAA